MSRYKVGDIVVVNGTGPCDIPAGTECTLREYRHSPYPWKVVQTGLDSHDFITGDWDWLKEQQFSHHPRETEPQADTITMCRQEYLALRKRLSEQETTLSARSEVIRDLDIQKAELQLALLIARRANEI